MPNKVTIVQARMRSSRLPEKVMKPILGKSVLELMMERLLRSQKCGTVVVATSDQSADDVIETHCKEKGYPVFRGNENDLLDRHYQCAKLFQADIVAKIPSDCPLIDPQIIDKVFEHYEAHNYDFVSNLHPASYPDGNDVEIFSFAALERAHSEAQKQLEREHTTPYFWEHPEIFSIANVTWETGLDYAMSHRFTLDYIEDFEFIKTVYEELYPTNPHFSLGDILRLLESKPEIYAINAKYAGVNWYRNHLDELKTVDSSMTKSI